MGTTINNSCVAIPLNNPALKKAAEKTETRPEGISAKDFITKSQDEQRKIANQLDNNARQKLFDEIRQSYADVDNGEAKNQRILAALEVSVCIINNMTPYLDYKQLAVNVLKFMHANMSYVDTIKDAPPRDACMFSGEQVLAEGNFNGCAEAAKLFEALYTRCAEQNGFIFVNCAYASSFNVDRANLKAVQGDDAPWGHAVVELEQEGESFLVNAARFIHPLLGVQQAISLQGLEMNEIFLHADKNGIYKMTIKDGSGNDRQETYKLFAKGKYNLQSNPENLFDPKTSDGATRTAILNFLEELRPVAPQK